MISHNAAWLIALKAFAKSTSRSTAECELCRRIKEMTDGNTQGDVPVESIGHIQSAGCLGQSEVVTTAHNECIRGLIGDLQMHRKKRSNLTFLTMES